MGLLTTSRLGGEPRGASSPWTAFDVASAALSISDAVENPSFGNVAGAVYDTAAVFVPFWPGGVGAIRHADDVADAVGTAVDAAKGAGNVADAAKGADNVVDSANAADNVGDAAAGAGSASSAASTGTGGMVGSVPVAPTGKGTASPSERDPQRFFTSKQKEEMRANQGGECTGDCGSSLKEGEGVGHHNERHSDGGRTSTDNGSLLCPTCHAKVHSPKARSQEADKPDPQQ